MEAKKIEAKKMGEKNGGKKYRQKKSNQKMEAKKMKMLISPNYLLTHTKRLTQTFKWGIIIQNLWT